MLFSARTSQRMELQNNLILHSRRAITYKLLSSLPEFGKIINDLKNQLQCLTSLMLFWWKDWSQASGGSTNAAINVQQSTMSVIYSYKLCGSKSRENRALILAGRRRSSVKWVLYLSLNVSDLYFSAEHHRPRRPLFSGRGLRCSSAETLPESRSSDLAERRQDVPQ